MKEPDRTGQPPRDTDPQQRTLPLGDIPVSYTQGGSGPPLLLVHGWGGSSSYWATTFERCTNKHTCYAPDLPGYGKTPPVQGKSASAESLADFVVAFADALKLDQFDLNGHSFGGAVAAYVAARHPERVRHLVLTCFGTFGTELEQQLVSQAYYQMDLTLTMSKPWLMLWQPWMSAWQRCVAEAGKTTSAPKDLARPFFHRLPTDAAMLNKGYTDFTCMDYRSSLESATSLGAPLLRAALQSISAPVLLISARQDLMIMPARVEGAARLISNARIAWIDQCGHIPMIERPEEYNRLLCAFLSTDPDQHDLSFFFPLSPHEPGNPGEE